MQDAVHDYILNWNTLFPLDKVYRKKYNIPFGSKKHLNACQIDIMFDIMEVFAFKRAVDELELSDKKAKAAEQGIWLSNSQSTTPDTDSDFDSIDF